MKGFVLSTDLLIGLGLITLMIPFIYDMHYSSEERVSKAVSFDRTLSLLYDCMYVSEDQIQTMNLDLINESLNECMNRKVNLHILRYSEGYYENLINFESNSTIVASRVFTVMDGEEAEELFALKVEVER